MDNENEKEENVQQLEEGYFRIDFVNLLNVMNMNLTKSSPHRNRFLTDKSNVEQYINIIDNDYPISGQFVLDISNHFTNFEILIREDKIKDDKIYLNKETLGFIVAGIDEERTKIFKQEYETLGNPEKILRAAERLKELNLL